MNGDVVFFLIAAAAGFINGFLFDIFRVIRKITPRNVILTQIEDILFWIIASLFFFFIMLNANFGHIRVYTILGAFLGAVIYFCSLSRVFLAVSGAIIRFIEKIVKIPVFFIKKLLHKFKYYVKIITQQLVMFFKGTIKKV